MGNWWNKKKMFLNQEDRFRLKAAYQVLLIPCVALIFSSFMIWIFMSMNHIYLESNGLVVHDSVREAFFDSVLSSALGVVPYAVGIGAGIFLVGYYIGGLLLRPFLELSYNCAEVLDDPDYEIEKSVFSRFNIMSNFSRFFFKEIKKYRQEKSITASKVRKKFRNISGPVFDKSFFLEYSFFMFLLSCFSILALYMGTIEIHARIVDISIGMMPKANGGLEHFLNAQKELLTSIQIIVSIFIINAYAILGKNLMKEMNGVTFAFFKGMREYVSHDFSSRISLRFKDPAQDSAKYVNKFLDLIEEEIYSVDETETSDDDLEVEADMPPPLPPMPFDDAA